VINSRVLRYINQYFKTRRYVGWLDDRENLIAGSVRRYINYFIMIMHVYSVIINFVNATKNKLNLKQN